MTQTISINLGGLLFHIDDEAYKALDSYLRAIERQFNGELEQKEIVADIEARISELFCERIDRKKDLVTAADVTAVINIMGEPHNFKDEEEPKPNHKEQKEQKFRRQKTIKRMYRDSENRILGGVCSGLGAYFKLDSWIFRILFLIFTLFFFSGFIIYVILWITIPEATTTAQKLEMHGKPIDIENIKTKVKEEFDHVKSRMNFKNQNYFF